ncbi:MAG: M28 family peptidase, partial [Bacteroidota bacterium]
MSKIYFLWAKTSLLWGLAICLSGSALAQSVQQVKVDLVYLASDYLQGRETGKEGERLAAEYLAYRFAEMGLKPLGDEDSYFQTFDFTYSPNPHAAGGEERQGRNVVALLDNEAPTTVVIGAHYDHIGSGAFGSRYTGEPAIHNGADDNASGTA